VACIGDRNKMRHLICLCHTGPEMSQTPVVTWMWMSPAASVPQEVDDERNKEALGTVILWVYASDIAGLSGKETSYMRRKDSTHCVTVLSLDNRCCCHGLG
jgi:hypothetical protein